MPTYDYKCEKCEHRWEAFQSITSKPLRKCPECGGLKAKRVFGPGAGILFKGSGFYQTDYRSDSYKKGAAADKNSTASTPAPAKSDTGSDSPKASGSASE